MPPTQRTRRPRLLLSLLALAVLGTVAGHHSPAPTAHAAQVGPATAEVLPPMFATSRSGADLV